MSDAPPLSSRRYAVIDVYDRYSRHRTLVEEARRYARVLECGCATGFLSRLIAENGGPDLVGIELDPAAAEEAARHCRRVVVADLRDPGWAAQVGERFDLVIFGDVLEHLSDPAATLRAAGAVLAPEGRLLVSLPNVAHWTIRAKLLLGRFDYRPTGIMDVTHLRFYTRKSAVAMFASAGYRQIWFKPVFHGRFTTRARPFWNLVTRALPGPFAFQMLFLLEPADLGTRPSAPHD